MKFNYFMCYRNTTSVSSVWHSISSRFSKFDFPNSQIKKQKRTGLWYHPVRSNCQLFQHLIFRNICDLWNEVIHKSNLKCNNTSLKAFKKQLKAHFLLIQIFIGKLSRFSKLSDYKTKGYRFVVPPCAVQLPTFSALNFSQYL